MTRKLTITVSLSDDDMEVFLETLGNGAKAWYGASLQAKALRIHEYVKAQTEKARKRRRAKEMRVFNEELTRVGMEMDKEAGLIK